MVVAQDAVDDKYYYLLARFLISSARFYYLLLSSKMDTVFHRPFIWCSEAHFKFLYNISGTYEYTKTLSVKSVDKTDIPILNKDREIWSNSLKYYGLSIVKTIAVHPTN